jgi:hypothetical protein
MPFARFSDENMVAEGMHELGISYAFLSAVTDDGPYATVINSWLCGCTSLDPAKSRALVQTIRDLKAIANEHRLGDRSVPLSFKDAGLWRELLAIWRAAQRQSEVQW